MSNRETVVELLQKLTGTGAINRMSVKENPKLITPVDRHEPVTISECCGSRHFCSHWSKDDFKAQIGYGFIGGINLPIDKSKKEGFPSLLDHYEQGKVVPPTYVPVTDKYTIVYWDR